MNSLVFLGSNLFKPKKENTLVLITNTSQAVILDSSGSAASNSSAIAGYSSTAWGINPSNTYTTFLTLKKNGSYLLTPTSGDFTFYIKHKARLYTDPIFGHGYILTSSVSSVNAGGTFSVSFYSLDTTINLLYTITGVTEADLNNSPLNGYFSSNYQEISFTVASPIQNTKNMVISYGSQFIIISILP